MTTNEGRCEPRPELLPCPFCGGGALYTPTCHIDVVQCRVCGAQGMAAMGQHEAAITAWNRRATPPATVAALVEALEGMAGAADHENWHLDCVLAKALSDARAALAAYREAGR